MKQSGQFVMEFLITPVTINTALKILWTWFFLHAIYASRLSITLHPEKEHYDALSEEEHSQC